MDNNIVGGDFQQSQSNEPEVTLTVSNPNSSNKSPYLGERDSEENEPFIVKNPSDEDIEVMVPPKDQFNLVYLIVLLHGIGVLLPWNAFLSIAEDYFIRFKFENVSGALYASYFFGFLTACAQIPNFLLTLLNLFIVLKGGLSRRINISLSVIAIICLLTIAMVFVNSSSWPFQFFVFTMFTVIILNSANGVYQNCVWGLIADFPARFTNAVVIGNNICGIFVTCAYICILFLEANAQVTSAIFFGIALLTVIACFATFHMLPKLAYFRYYTNKAIRARDSKGAEATILLNVQQNGHQTEAQNHAKVDFQHPTLAMYVATSKEVWSQLMDVFLVFFVTLAIFPTVLMNIGLYPPGRKFDKQIFGTLATSQSLYTQLTIFLNFNLFATIGSFVANYVQWPSPKYLSFATVSRLLLLPLFWLCNYNPDKNFVREFVLFKDDYAVIILITLLAITQGYYSSLAMMYAPRQVDQSKARIVGMMSGFFLVFGITCGILFTFVEPYIIKLCALIFSGS